LATASIAALRTRPPQSVDIIVVVGTFTRAVVCEGWQQSASPFTLEARGQSSRAPTSKVQGAAVAVAEGQYEHGRIG
jgi:hypothetical protein